MKTAQPKKNNELRINSAEFDRIMRGALQAHPKETPKPKRSVKTKPKTERTKKPI